MFVLVHRLNKTCQEKRKSSARRLPCVRRKLDATINTLRVFGIALENVVTVSYCWMVSAMVNAKVD